MSLLKALSSALKIVKKEKDEARLAKELTDSPITIELIRRIARDFDYHFEIVQKDGTILRFKKSGVTSSVDETEGEVW